MQNNTRQKKNTRHRKLHILHQCTATDPYMGLGIVIDLCVYFESIKREAKQK